jgi:SdpI/YfhL protein family
MYLALAILWLLPPTLVVSYYCAASGKLGPNDYVGLRLPSTLASVAAWRAGHRAALPIMCLTLPVVLASIVGVAVTEPGSRTVVGWSTATLVVPIVIGAIVTGNNAARRAGRD